MIKLPTLYTRTATGAVNVWNIWSEGDSVYTSWGQAQGLQQQTSFKVEPKNVGKKNATTAEQQAVKEAEAEWKKKLKKKYFQTAEEALSSTAVKPMLAKDFPEHKHKLKYPVAQQKKFNGVRCLAYWKDGEVYLQSRGGDPYHIDHIKKELARYLPQDVVLDGELYTHGLSLQRITSLVRKYTEESKVIQYHVYDGLFEDQEESFALRLANLQNFFNSVRSQLVDVYQVETINVNSEQEVLAAEKEYVADGYEGVMVRSYESEYRQGHRSDKLLKVKTFTDGEFKIIGWKVGKGKFEGVPIFVCETDEGKEFDVSPKGSMEDRAEMLAEADSMVGKMYKVKYFAWTDERKPQFPVGLALRLEQDM